MSFGDQVVALVVVSQAGVPGRFGLKALNSVATRLPGCHFRPVGVTETPDIETDIATETWKLTAPAEAAALRFRDELIYDGTDHPENLTPGSEPARPHTFQVQGPPMPKYDLDGSVHHVTVMCTRKAG